MIAVAIAAPLALAGCANNAQQGAGVGALAGALAGSLTSKSKNKEQNALIGAAIGGALGYMIGNEMDKADKQRLRDVYETSPSNKTSSWVNPDSGNQYRVTPKPAVTSRSGQVCRDAEIEAVIDGRRETVVQRACRLPDGRWEAG
ncbi:putative 17 kDa surface antigen [Magnetofaba australis IT-1]|uniref:Putative 17 kDa surface antigen n=2 Tax=Magnetofaba TaxID=1472292 RepID=A0A1Y2K3A7_9PROT|nr:putative 17 kDa surface antigen [Magnetofaba australis IT-1]